MGFRKSIELKILRDVLSSKNGVYLYTIPPKYKITPQTLMSILKKYNSYIMSRNGVVKVIPNKELSLRQRFFPRKSDMGEGNGLIIPSEFLGPQIGIDDFYCPFELIHNQEELAF